VTIRQLAAYSAPVFWLSPDEPTLDGKTGTAMRIPAVLPFEDDPNAPVVYYQYNQILEAVDADGPGFFPDSSDRNNSILDLHNIKAVDLKYIAYFPREEGVGAHQHDVEPTEFRIRVVRSSEEWMQDYPEIRCDELHYVVLVSRVTGEAHGLSWYYNVLVVDEATRFPIHLLVEEGKHAICTDKNGDGHYTPGYDVNRRINDAWGVRDIIRGGILFTGGYRGWMSKVRQDAERVFPPLPEDSPLRAQFVRNGEYAPDNAVYQLRAFPSAERAAPDRLLQHKMAEKDEPGWPEIDEHTSAEQLGRWLDEGVVLKSYALSLRYAGGNVGLVLAFPFLVVRNVENPMTGGWIVQRIYLVDKSLRDFGWGVLFTPSASRWLDTYMATGVEWDDEPSPDGGTRTKAAFVTEAGIKLRVNIAKAPPPLRYLAPLTGFWGLRVGLLNRGWPTLNRIAYVVEFGAGVF
jgi:hypothetical protein